MKDCVILLEAALGHGQGHFCCRQGHLGWCRDHLASTFAPTITHKPLLIPSPISHCWLLFFSCQPSPPSLLFIAPSQPYRLSSIACSAHLFHNPLRLWFHWACAHVRMYAFQPFLDFLSMCVAVRSFFFGWVSLLTSCPHKTCFCCACTHVYIRKWPFCYMYTCALATCTHIMTQKYAPV